ncbi:MAG: carbohydrate binding family 9 domain-containing protein [Gammaproteobacteria bacterium]|nr:carbohydrate binding family 9 domain-containing protein [Gammaproteobacteria bacterium]
MIRLLVNLAAALCLTAAASALAAQSSQSPKTIPDISPWVGEDGKPDAAAWRHAAQFSIDNEFQPGRNVPAPVATEVFVGYTDTALWLRFVAHDPQPGEILAKYRRHDNFGNDQDFVGVIFSPFNNQTGYEFFCSAAGTELDMFRQRGDEYDSYDAIWNCDSRLTENGYVAVMKVPFESLKFPQSDRPQTWSIVFIRNWPRSVRHKMLQIRFNYNGSCLLCQAQIVETATPIRAHGTNVQILPSVTLSRTDERATPSSGLEQGSPEIEPSLDARWAIRPDLAWSATLNPNFSQVAPDVLESTVNRRFAIFYPENRPFFRRGTWVFNTPGFDFGHYGAGGNFVDTRQIADPDWASKMVGQIGPHAMGALIADDAITNILVPGRTQSALESFNFSTRDALLRYRHDFAGNSAVGMLVTGRRGGGYDNTVVAVDGRWQIDPSNALTLQTAHSSTYYPDDVAAAFGIQPGRVTGNGWVGTYDLTRRNFNASVSAGHVASGFRADLGFLPQVGYNEARGEFEYNFYSNTAWWNNGGFGTTYDWVQATDGGPVLDRSAEIYTFVHAIARSHVFFSVSHEDQYFGGKTFSLLQYTLRSDARPLSWMELDLDVTAGDAIDYVGVRKGDLLSISPAFTLVPGRHLQIEFVNNFERLNVQGGRLYTANLYDVRVAWHFNSQMFVRAIVQAQNIRRNTALYPPGTQSRTRTIATQWLFGYVLNPWTSLFAGYSNGYLGTGGAGIVEQRRSFFLKLSYAWQL